MYVCMYLSLNNSVCLIQTLYLENLSTPNAVSSAIH